MERLFAIVIVALLVAVSGLTAPPARAGFEQQMEQTFGAMSNYTSPTVVTSSTRGVISGGGFQVRNKIVTADLLTLRLPKLSSGCGGWDIFGGSFSWISSEQIVAMLRSIASSAVAYAFKLALQAISDAIAKVMGEMFADMNFTNIMGKNSCELGMALVDTFKSKAVKTESDNAGATSATESGAADDSNEAKRNMKTDSPAADAAKKETDPELKKAIIKGNHVWNALSENNADSWASFGGKEFLEDIMSVTGTIIMCVPGVDGCPDAGGASIGQNNAVLLQRAPRIGLSELVKGSYAYSKVTVWRCNDDDCLDPQEQTKPANYKGTEQLLRIALLGPSESMGEGLIGRYATNSGAPTAADKGMITAGGGFVSMAMNLASRNEQDARDFVNTFSEVIAADMTYNVLNEALGKVAAAASTYESGSAVEAQALVHDARSRVREELKKFHSNSVADTSKWDYFTQLVGNRPPPRLPAVSVGSGK